MFLIYFTVSCVLEFTSFYSLRCSYMVAFHRVILPVHVHCVKRTVLWSWRKGIGALHLFSLLVHEFNRSWKSVFMKCNALFICHLVVKFNIWRLSINLVWIIIKVIFHTSFLHCVLHKISIELFSHHIIFKTFSFSKLCWICAITIVYLCWRNIMIGCSNYYWPFSFSIKTSTLGLRYFIRHTLIGVFSPLFICLIGLCLNEISLQTYMPWYGVTYNLWSYLLSFILMFH